MDDGNADDGDGESDRIPAPRSELPEGFSDGCPTYRNIVSAVCYSAFATGEVGKEDLGCSVFIDEPGDIADEQTHARFVHASPDAPSVNVQVADGGPVLCEDIGFRESSGYVPVDAGTYDLEVVPTGTSEPALSLPGTELTAGTAISAIAVGKLDDESLGALLVEDTA